jgi:hypothetical protein
VPLGIGADFLDDNAADRRVDPVTADFQAAENLTRREMAVSDQDRRTIPHRAALSVVDAIVVVAAALVPRQRMLGVPEIVAELEPFDAVILAKPDDEVEVLVPKPPPSRLTRDLSGRQLLQHCP